MSNPVPFTPNSQRSPATLRISTASYKDLDFADRKFNDDMIFVVKGKVKEIREDFESKEHILLEVELESIEDMSRRSGLDDDGRVK